MVSEIAREIRMIHDLPDSVDAVSETVGSAQGTEIGYGILGRQYSPEG